MGNWTAIKNNKCLVSLGYARFVYCHQCCRSKIAIDELGRLFAWGNNYDGECGIGSNVTPITKPTLVGQETNWVKAEGGEYAFIALNTKGELWGCGSAYPQNSLFALPRIDDPNQYAYRSLVRVAPNMRFKDFGMGWYGCYGIGMDDYLYVWGASFGYDLGIDIFSELLTYTPVTYSNLIYEPTRQPGFDKKVKLVSGDYSCGICATLDDEIYVWGEYSYPNTLYKVPTKVTGLPANKKVVQVGIAYYIYVVLLEDGTLWAAGDVSSLAGYGVPISESFVQIPTTFPIVGFNLEEEAAFIAWDIQGNLWFSGWAYYSSGRPEPYCNFNDYGLYICCAEDVGQRTYQKAILSGFNNNHVCIDNNGYLYGWGNNVDGKLGYGLTYAQLAYSCIPQLCAPAVNGYGETLGLNTPRADGTAAYAPTPEQESQHEPCGHWHLREQEEEVILLCNCWDISLDISDSNRVFLTASGRHWPFHLVYIDYDISSRTYIMRIVENTTRKRIHEPGQAKYCSTFTAYYNGKYDIASGTNDYDYTVANPGMGLWITKDGIDSFYQVLTDSPENGYGRMGIHENGTVSFVSREGSFLVIHTSADFGVTWATYSIAYTTSIVDYQLLVTETGDIFFFRMTNTGLLTTIKSTDKGASWTSVSSATFLSGATGFTIRRATGQFHAVFRTALGVHLFKSSSNGSSWSYYGARTAKSNSLLLECSMVGNVVHVGDGITAYTTDIFNMDFSTGVERDMITKQFGILGSNNNGVFGYSHFALTSRDIDDPHNAIIILVSEDMGSHWVPHYMPLNYLFVEYHNDCNILFPINKANWTGVEKWVAGWPKITIPKF